MPSEQSPEILEALKRCAAALREVDRLRLVGGLAAWAHGGPATEHDIDLMVREQDAETALAALRAVGMPTACPPEGWLVKAWHDDILIDLIYSPRGVIVDTMFLEQCDVMNVAAVDMRVDLARRSPRRQAARAQRASSSTSGLRSSGRVRCESRSAGPKSAVAPTSRPSPRAFFHLLVELNVLDGQSELVVR